MRLWSDPAGAGRGWCLRSTPPLSSLALCFLLSDETHGAQSIMVGESRTTGEVGRPGRCTAIAIDTGRSSSRRHSSHRSPPLGHSYAIHNSTQQDILKYIQYKYLSRTKLNEIAAAWYCYGMLLDVLVIANNKLHYSLIDISSASYAFVTTAQPMNRQ